MTNFMELSQDELMDVDGGGLWNLTQATIGTVMVATAPIIGVTTGLATVKVAGPGAVATGVAAGAAWATAGSNLIANAVQ